MKRRLGMRSCGNDATADELAMRSWAQNAAVAELQGQRSAVHLYRFLAAGHLPPTLPITSPDGSAVHLDVALQCASWGGQEVEYQQFSVFVVGSSPLVTTSLLSAAVANRSNRQRAAAAARPRWRDHGVLRFLVTSTATWCGRGSDWRHFAHSSIIGYEVNMEACLIALADAPPLRLAGPAVWSHSVLLAYFRYGPDRWLHAPLLQPMRGRLNDQVPVSR